MSIPDHTSSPNTGANSTSGALTIFGVLVAIFIYVLPLVTHRAVSEQVASTLAAATLALGVIAVKIYHDLRRRQFASALHQAEAFVAGAAPAVAAAVPQAATLAANVDQAVSTLGTVLAAVPPPADPAPPTPPPGA